MKNKLTIEDMNNSLAELKDAVLKLGENIKDLKCCGNCKHLTNNTCGMSHLKLNEVCDDWQWDGLTQKERL